MVPTGPVARRYHDLTAHSPDSVRASGHELDWENKPFPFKVYTDIPGLHLPREIDVLATPALAAIAGEDAAPQAGLTLAVLTSLLYYMAGVTKRKTYPGGGEVLFRAAASTGALYQTEGYVVAGGAGGRAGPAPGGAGAAARGELCGADAHRARDAAAVAPRGGRAAGGAGPRGVGPRDARRRRPLARRPCAGASAGGRPADRAAGAPPARRPRARRDDPPARLHPQLPPAPPRRPPAGAPRSA